MIKLYSNHCPACNMTKAMLEQKNIEFEIIDDENVFMPIAEANNIMSMPFAEADGEIMNADKLLQCILKGGC